MKKIFEILISALSWTIGIVLFIPFGLSIILTSFVMNPKYIDGNIKAGCRFIMWMMGIHISTEGKSLIDKNKTYIFMANHVNLFDGLVLYGHIPNYARGVELDKHFSWPFWGYLIRRMGMIPISRTQGKSALASLEKARKSIEQGTSIIILPEGTRTLDGNLKPFKRGPFYLALKAQADIVPVAMLDAFRIKRKGSWLIKPGKMKIRFDKPIPFDQIKDMEIADIHTLVKTKISQLIES